MKKSIFIIGVAILTFIAFSIVACGNNAPASENEPPDWMGPEMMNHGAMHYGAMNQSAMNYGTMNHDGHQGDGGHNHFAGARSKNRTAATVRNGFDGMPATGTSAFCPVLKNEFEVTPNSTHSVYKGKTYVFCCPGCKPRFDENPEKYI